MLALPVLKSLITRVTGVHSLLAWSPLAGAHLSVLLNMLERLYKAQDLVDVTADGQIIELHVSEDTLAVDDEGCT